MKILKVLMPVIVQKQVILQEEIHKKEKEMKFQKFQKLIKVFWEG